MFEVLVDNKTDLKMLGKEQVNVSLTIQPFPSITSAVAYYYPSSSAYIYINFKWLF